MQLRNPFFSENFYQDQPYPSLLLMAPYCDWSCSGCQSLPLREQEVVEFTTAELLQTYNDNPFVEGYTVGGLEILLSGKPFEEQLIDLIKASNHPKLTLYTRFELHEIMPLAVALYDHVSGLFVKIGPYIPGTPPKEVKLDNYHDWTIKIFQNQDFLRLK